MSILRKASVWVLAMTLIGFAHPALAQKSQTKYGSVNFQPLLSGSGTVTVEVKFLNSTPKPGVSTINSAWAKITNAASTSLLGVGVAGVQKLTISDGTVDNTVTAKHMSGALCSTSSPCTEFTITDFTGIGNNLSGTFLLTLVGVPNACVNILWDAEANTGNSYPGGDPFLLTKYNLSTGCDGTLACWDGTPPIPANAMFNGSAFGASDDTDSGFFAGFRAAYKTECTPVPFKTYNNVGGSAPLVDAFNTTVPPNYAVINYPSSATNGVLIAHTITFAVELSSTNGLPSSSRATFYCVQGTDCTGTNRKPALGCTSPDIAITSIPFVGSVQEPGCVRGASWVIVPASDPRCDAINGTSTTQTCVQWAVDFLEAKDPPWGRGEL